MHKSPPTFRFIAGISNIKDQQSTSTNQDPIINTFTRPLHQPICSTTQASKQLSKYLQDIIKVLKHKDDQLFKHHGIRRCWIVQSTDQLFYEIKQNLTHLQSFTPTTYDFTTMYTNLQQNHIIHNIQRAIKEAQQHLQSISRFQRNKVSNDLPKSIDLSKTMEHLQFIVSNTYLANNINDIKQQTIGIPMGTNASPNIANLTLYVDESDFIDKIILNRGSSFDNLSVETYTDLYHADHIKFIYRVLDLDKKMSIYLEQKCMRRLIDI
jgi:hypothetical protein